MTATPATRATRTARQIQAVTRHCRASHPAVMRLAASMATAIPTTDSCAPPVQLESLKSGLEPRPCAFRAGGLLEVPHGLRALYSLPARRHGARVQKQRFRNQDASDHRRRGHVMTAIESSSPANAGMTARPVIQVRSISAAVAWSRPKLAHETFAAAASAPGSAADIDMVGGNGTDRKST